jgi:hypothetical protein
VRHTHAGSHALHYVDVAVTFKSSTRGTLGSNYCPVVDYPNRDFSWVSSVSEQTPILATKSRIWGVQELYISSEWRARDVACILIARNDLFGSVADSSVQKKGGGGAFRVPRRKECLCMRYSADCSFADLVMNHFDTNFMSTFALGM